MPGSVNGPGSVMVTTRAPGASGSGCRTKLCAAVLDDTSALRRPGRTLRKRSVIVDDDEDTNAREVAKMLEKYPPKQK